MTSSIILAVGLSFINPYFPLPQERGGIGLRVHRLSKGGPFLIGEPIEQVRFKVLLLNFSKETLIHDPLPVAHVTGELELAITEPDGKLASRVSRRPGLRDPLTQQDKIQSGEFTSFGFRVSHFGYARLSKTGIHRMSASLTLNGNKVTSPPLVFEVVDMPEKAILQNYVIALEGAKANAQPDERERAVVQVIALERRTLLVYRRFLGSKYDGKPDWTFRLAELPGKVEMKVEGAYGAGGPLTITYKDANAKSGTTRLVINSIDGTPWSEEDEKEYQKRLKSIPKKP